MCELFENRIYFQQTRCKPAKFKKYVCHNTEEMCTRRIIVSLYFRFCRALPEYSVMTVLGGTRNVVLGSVRQSLL